MDNLPDTVFADFCRNTEHTQSYRLCDIISLRESDWSSYYLVMVKMRLCVTVFTTTATRHRYICMLFILDHDRYRSDTVRSSRPTNAKFLEILVKIGIN